MINKIYLIPFLAIFLSVSSSNNNQIDWSQFIPDHVINCLFNNLTLRILDTLGRPCIIEDWFAPPEFNCNRTVCNKARLVRAIKDGNFRLFLDLWRQNEGCRSNFGNMLRPGGQFGECGGMTFGRMRFGR